jgi:hypothetical protein
MLKEHIIIIMDNNEKKMKIEYLIAHKNNLWAGVIAILN